MVSVDYVCHSSHLGHHTEHCVQTKTNSSEQDYGGKERKRCLKKVCNYMVDLKKLLGLLNSEVE